MISGLSMHPFQVTDLEKQLILNPKWNVLEPNPALCKEVSIDRIDFAIIPGIAFDSSHARLGYGKGFYDRFLAKLSCPLIGVGFKEQLLKLPFTHEKHDVFLTNIYLF